ncbi:acylphosphatase [Ignatzschineria cameli]|uniref:acylphosphatase n=1 Tax=Ignatzschineria cameli TaxID=2182793 RepID=UPI000D606B11|nr:acylphosphatase [Ignatzschineria cameli]PWD86044.1 hypothetical protein DC080_04620 [Ignatzschineria cameli]
MKILKNTENKLFIYPFLEQYSISQNKLLSPKRLSSSIISSLIFSQKNINHKCLRTNHYSIFNKIKYNYIIRKKFNNNDKEKAYIFYNSLIARGENVGITPYHNLSLTYKKITSSNDFNELWREFHLKNSFITLEIYQSGDPFKIFYKGKNILGIYSIVPAFVIGDGSSKLFNLITKLKKSRENNILYKKYNLEKINDNLNMNDIPLKGEIIQLKNSQQIQYGACYIDLTEHLRNKFQPLINQLNELSGLDDYFEITCFSENIKYGPKHATFYISEIKSKIDTTELLSCIDNNNYTFISDQANLFSKELNNEIIDYDKADIYKNDHFLNTQQSYVLREAAYQLGLKVDAFSPHLLVIQDVISKKSVTFFSGMSQYTSNKARLTTLNKQLTKDILNKNGINTPTGELYHIHHVEKAINYIKKNHHKKFVVKPLNLQGGLGVSTDITSKEQLISAWERCKNLKCNNIIIEEQIDGDDYRVTVIGNQVCAVSRRVAPFIIGNGKNTIQELVELKNLKRKENIYLAKNLIKINDFVIRNLALQGLSLESIPKENLKVSLSKVSNVGSGGEIIDCSSIFHKDWIPIAINIRKLMSDAFHVGIDFLMEDISKSPLEQNWGVIEVNTNPAFAVHIFPSEGHPRNVGKLFLKKIFTPSEQNKITYHLQIIGKVQNVSFRKWFKKICEFRSVNGFIQNDPINENLVKATIVGFQSNIDEIVKLSYQGPQNAKVDQIRLKKSKDNSYQNFDGLEIR